MKKTFSLLASFAFVTLANADVVKYLTFRTADGTEQSLPIAAGVDITFASGEIVATAPGSEFRASLNDMRDMWFTYETTSIDEVLADCATAGAKVEVFSSDGRRLTQFDWTPGQPPALPAGYYIVRTAGRTQKVYIKAQ